MYYITEILLQGLCVGQRDEGGFKMTLEQIIEDLCGHHANGSQPGLCVGVMQEGRVLYSKGFGKANLEYDIPINEYTVFHCCSITTQFTATCIALLEQEGKISVDQPVNEILPLDGDIWKKITVKHLIHMTNGLFDAYTTANFICGIREDDYFTKDEFWQFINACDWLMSDPGTCWNYGNTGYFLLAEIVEKISGVRISEFTDKHIFKPLGMCRSLLRDDKSKIIPNRAIGYSNYDYLHYHDDKPYCTREDKLCINADQMEIPGAGQLWSCVHDLFLWEMNLYNNKLGYAPHRLIDKLLTAGTLRNGAKTRYAYGQFMFCKNGREHVAHGGWSGGYSCFIDRVLSKGISIIVLANHTDIYNDIEVFDGSDGIIDKILSAVIKDEKPDQKATISGFDFGSKADIVPFIGKYQNTHNSIIWEICYEDNRLIIKENFGHKINIERLDNKTFMTENNEVIHVNVYSDGKYSLAVEKADSTHDIFQAFINRDLTPHELDEYVGIYENAPLNEAYRVSALHSKLYFENVNRHHTALDLCFEPTIKDYFLTKNDYIPYYCVTFHRDQSGAVKSFSFRDDEKTMRENFMFVLRN